MSKSAPIFRWSRAARTTLFCLVLAGFITPASFAEQAATTTLTGRVFDPNGAVIPGAQVMATQTSTAIKRETTTNTDGLYVLTGLPPGEYDLRVQAKGFSVRTSSSPILLQVGQSKTVDVSLAVGGTSETVDLVGE